VIESIAKICYNDEKNKYKNMRKFLAAIMIYVLGFQVFAQISTAEAASPKIISRSSWGADESVRLYKDTNPEPELISLPSDFYLRYGPELKLFKIVQKNDKGEYLTWPIQYPEKVTKIIIHHTATTKNLDDPVKAMQDLLIYHAVSRGWGDIGYNYVIDNKGNIYEGRYGGEGVVGAHAGPGNRGSIGISVLGNYNDTELSPESLKSLEALIAEKSKLYGIDPKGESWFRGKKLPNIIGHNSVMATSCPGKNIIALLPQIREDVAKLNGNFNYANIQKTKEIKDYSFEYLGSGEPIKTLPDKRTEFQIKLKNTGKLAWGSATRLKLEANSLVDNSFSSSSAKLKELKVLPGQTGTFNVMVNSKLNPGFFYLSYQPLINGKNALGDLVNIPVLVDKPIFAYEKIDFALPKTNIKTGGKLTAIMTLKNIGNVSWRNYGENRICLGADNPRDRVSAFTESSRMGFLKENYVKPGQNGHFIFTLKAPKTAGVYEEYFAPVIEKIAWLDGNGMKFLVNVFS